MTAHSVKQPRPATLTHRSLDRGLRIIEVIASTGSLTSLAEIARRTGLHRSTTYHLLQTLVDLGYLRQDLHSRGYEIAAKLFSLTERMWTPEQIGAAADPLIAEFTRRTGEGSSVAVYRDGKIRVVAKRDADGPVRVVQNIGAERPIHATAVGKAIIAFLPPSEVNGVLGRLRFERFTPRTIVARAAFEAELRRIRAAGYATDDEEHMEGIRCVSAPVFAYNGQVVASLCSVGPKSRMTRQKLRDLRQPLIDAAHALSERLGWVQDAAMQRRRA
jgi:IclR family acetate operon transcriptional repressor